MGHAAQIAPRESRRLAWPHRLLSSPGVAAVAVGGSALAAILFGFAGVGRSGATPFGFDGRFLQVAGAMWLRGSNPYVAPDFNAASRVLGDPAVGAFGFAYPPTAAPLAMVLGALSFRTGALVLAALNVAAAAAVIALTLQMQPPRAARRTDVRAFAVVAVLASPFAQHVFWMGQTTLIALAALLAGWWLGAVRGKTILGGVLLALSTMKPQLVALSLLWLAIEQRWRLMAAAAAAAALCALPATLASGGPLALAHDWVHALTRYAAGPVQALSSLHVFGLRSLFVLSGVFSPTCAAGAVGALAVAGLAFLSPLRATRVRSRQKERRETLSATVALTLTLSILLVYAHDYDLAALAPLAVFAWIESGDREGVATGLVTALALLFLPQRLLRGLTGVSAHPWLLHWREVVVGAIALASMLGLERVNKARTEDDRVGGELEGSVRAPLEQG